MARPGGLPFDDFDEFLLRSATGGSLPSTEEETRRVLISCGNRQWSFDRRLTLPSPTETDGHHSPGGLHASRHLSWDCGDGRHSWDGRCGRATSLTHSSPPSTSRMSPVGTVQEDEEISEFSQESARAAAAAAAQSGGIYFDATETQRHRTRPPKFSETNLERKRQVMFHRVRSFRITSKGIVREESADHGNKGHKKTKERSKSKAQSPEETPSRPGFHRVLVLGATGVGKRALIHDFMVPDSHPFVSTSIDDEGDKSVSILLDGEESTMEFVDLSDQEVNHFITAEQIDAYVVVYSVEDRKSFETAIDRLYEIRQEEGRHIAVILVANKADLVRTRVVMSEEGKSAAKTYDCKYIEVSAAIDHKIDELLVGILKQIRLLKQRWEKSGKVRHRKSEDPPPPPPHHLKDLCYPAGTAKHHVHVLGRFFRGVAKLQSKSCDNLYVL